MGEHAAISYDRFPTQGSYIGRTVLVCFNYDTAHTLHGIVVRDDTEAPGLMLIALEDGRFVRSTECQYAPMTNVTLTLDPPTRRLDT